MRTIRLLLVLLIASTSIARADDDAGKGPAIAIQPGGEPWVITKLRVTDCRAVRGLVGAPVDGSLKSGSWDGKVWEYDMRHAGSSSQYNYLHNDGLHITFADDGGFNAVLIRGGVQAKLFRDVQKYDQPESGKLVHEFAAGAKTSRAWFDEPVRTSKVSFFDVRDGVIADASFFRVRRGVSELKSTAEPLVSPVAEETALAAVGVDFEAEGGLKFTISVTDPLNPRLVLHSADYVAAASGRVHVICDFPDQVLPAGTKVSVAIDSAKPEALKNLKLEQYRIAKERALPEALEHRKFILHAIYTPVSEARPWNIWNNPGDDEKYFAQPADTGDVLQDRLRPFVRDIVMTLNQCRALDPEGKDPIVRQYYQWMFRKILNKSPGGMPAFPANFDKIDGVPEWASLVHQAWMQAREVPKWWIENRLAPNGEFGGEIADDTDMFQNYAAFPMLERDGVGGMVLDAGARMAELADEKKLSQGINKESMDPLHAYEEGMNHESLMAYWNYGDPIYLERCMAAAKSTEKLTMMTGKGHRHFISNELGVTELTTPKPPEREHGTHALMWHPTLMVAWYNRNPQAMQWLTQWADGWLAHMKPGEEGTDVKLPADETTKSVPLPFSGGWGMTGSVFTWLADLTGDARFIRPYNDYFSTTGKNTGIHLAEIYQMGMLAGGEQTLAKAKGAWDAVLYNRGTDGPPSAALYGSGDKAPMIAAIKKDIEELQRFPHMYTTVECFTDRVFLYPIINPAIAYTGGYTTRNKLNLTYAVSWDGFGTDYAALVTAATGQHLKVLLCNLSEKPLNGKGRLWRLEPGQYELTIGPDANNDDQVDRVERQETLSVTKGDAVQITLPPKVVQVLELKQTRKGEPIFGRADLALAQRELKMTGDKIAGVVHNIGNKDVSDVVVALVDSQGKLVQSKHLGKLAAPLDLEPKTMSFELTAPATGLGDWSVVVDPDNAVPEIFEGNNRVAASGKEAR